VHKLGALTLGTIAFRRGLLVGDIYVVDIDAPKTRNLTRTPRLDERQPAWRPLSQHRMYPPARARKSESCKPTLSKFA
jgi:hypothetical protein